MAWFADKAIEGQQNEHADPIARRHTYQMGLVVGEELLRFLVGDAGVDDDIVALVPVHGRRYPVLVAKLEGY